MMPLTLPSALGGPWPAGCASASADAFASAPFSTPETSVHAAERFRRGIRRCLIQLFSARKLPEPWLRPLCLQPAEQACACPGHVPDEPRNVIAFALRAAQPLLGRKILHCAHEKIRIKAKVFCGGSNHRGNRHRITSFRDKLSNTGSTDSGSRAAHSYRVGSVTRPIKRMLPDLFSRIRNRKG